MSILDDSKDVLETLKMISRYMGLVIETEKLKAEIERRIEKQGRTTLEHRQRRRAAAEGRN